jgi:hypothetical protein
VVNVNMTSVMKDVQFGFQSAGLNDQGLFYSSVDPASQIRDEGAPTFVA